MVAKIQAKTILRLRAAGLSRSTIAKSHKMAKKSVCSVFDRADELDIGYDDVADKDDDEVYRLVFPEKFCTERIFEQPDWDYVHKELGRTGVTLLLLHAEYVDSCEQTGGVFMSYATFCREYDSYVVSRDLTSHIERKAGRSVEVDWVGDTMEVCDPDTGELHRVYVFVACLPFSSLMFAEGFYSMNQEAWISAHTHAFGFFGGTTPILVPDNCKTGVIKNTVAELVLNEQYRRMAEYYGCAIIPARPRRPKDSIQSQVIFKVRRNPSADRISPLLF